MAQIIRVSPSLAAGRNGGEGEGIENHIPSTPFLPSLAQVCTSRWQDDGGSLLQRRTNENVTPEKKAPSISQRQDGTRTLAVIHTASGTEKRSGFYKGKRFSGADVVGWAHSAVTADSPHGGVCGWHAFFCQKTKKTDPIERSRSAMEVLPPELVDHILSYVGPLPHVVAVCSRWKEIATSKAIAKFHEPLKPKRYMALLAEWSARNVMEWARANGCPWDADVCASIASNGRLDMLEWARANGCPWGIGTCAYAAAGGHLGVLKWARTNGCPWDKWTCFHAAKGGHLDVLVWARANGCPWDEWTCLGAARQGKLEVLQWARANGCLWDKNTCAYAAMYGHLEVLKWARANGCPWNREYCAYCADKYHPRTSMAARINAQPL